MSEKVNPQMQITRKAKNEARMKEYPYAFSGPDNTDIVVQVPMWKLIDNLSCEIYILASQIDHNFSSRVSIIQWFDEIKTSHKDRDVKAGVEPATASEVIGYLKIHSLKSFNCINKALDPQITDEPGKWLAIRDSLGASLYRRFLKIRRKPKPEHTELPEKLPQYTFPEVRNAAYAIANPGEWTNVEGKPLLIHIREGQSLRTKLAVPDNYERMTLPRSYRYLRKELDTLGVSGLFFFNVLLSMVLKEGEIKLSLDQCMHILGWIPRTVEEREDKRALLFGWLKVFNNLSLHGEGTYKDRLTGQVVCNPPVK